MHAYVWKYGLINKVKYMKFNMEACVKKQNTHALNVAWIASHYCWLDMFHVGDISADVLAINRGGANESYACELQR